MITTLPSGEVSKQKRILETSNAWITQSQKTTDTNTHAHNSKSQGGLFNLHNDE